MAGQSNPFVGVDAGGTIGVFARAAEDEIGSQDTDIDDHSKEAANVGIAAVIDETGLATVRVRALGIGQARVQCVRCGLGEFQADFLWGVMTNVNPSGQVCQGGQMSVGHVLGKMGAQFPVDHVGGW